MMAGDAPPAAHVQREAARWVARLNSPECTEAERQAAQRWLAASEAHRRAFAEYQHLWESMEGLKSTPFPELEEARAYCPPARPRIGPLAAFLMAMLAAESYAQPS